MLPALFTVRSERLFCEQPGYHLLWLWFLDREFSEGSFDHSICAKNWDRVLSADVAKLFFAEVYDLSRFIAVTYNLLRLRDWNKPARTERFWIGESGCATASKCRNAERKRRRRQRGG